MMTKQVSGNDSLAAEPAAFLGPGSDAARRLKFEDFCHDLGLVSFATQRESLVAIPTRSRLEVHQETSRTMHIARADVRLAKDNLQEAKQDNPTGSISQTHQNRTNDFLCRRPDRERFDSSSARKRLR